MAETMRPADTCHMHPFATEYLAQERWEQLTALAQATPRRRPRRWLRELYVRRTRNHAADGREAFDVVGHCREQPA